MNGEVEPTGRKQAQAVRQLGRDRALAALHGAEHPVMLVDRIGQLVMLLLGDDRVVDQLR
jgi:hypothetical protein